MQTIIQVVFPLNDEHPYKDIQEVEQAEKHSYDEVGFVQKEALAVRA